MNPAYVTGPIDFGRPGHGVRCPSCGRPTENADDGRYCAGCGWREVPE